MIRTASALFLAAALSLGCGSKAKPAAHPDDTGKQTRVDAGKKKNGDAVGTTAHDGKGGSEQMGPIYFDYDSDALREDARDELGRIADYLKSNAGSSLTIEGHCDERGTTEYNLALGDRRARVIRTYLARLGVAEKRLSVISYGEEHPAVGGHDEDAWAKNRRGEVVPR